MSHTRLSLVTFLTLAVAAPAVAQTIGVTDTKVAVLSTGSGPKRPLRYKVAAGAKERVEMKMAMGLSMEMPGMGTQSIPAPALTMGIDLDVTSVTPSGDISVAMTVPTATMEGEGLPAGMLDPLKGLAAAITMDGRGLVKSMKIDDSKINDPQLKQLLSSSGLDRLAMPLPEEPMGVGGRWQATQALDANGIKMDQITTFEILEMTESSVTLSTTVTQSAAPQTVSPPGMPAGVEASVSGMSGGGSGKLTLVDGALTMFGEMNLKTNISMDVNAGGQSQRINTSTDVKMTISRAKRQ